MVPQVGQRIGPYEILGRLGSGGMGLVFSAWDARLQRDVAIKILREEYVTSEMRSRFLQEARAASGLNHPNICTIFDIGEQDGDPFLVMELLRGETLRHRINAGNISLNEILRVGREIADALSAAHARSIIHRDIKPANIILVEKPGGGFGTKVLDFGLAKIAAYGAESMFDLTNTGTTVGTVSYMSPEQARGETLDARSDLFSLGVMLYEMAVGRVPFQGATSALVFVELLSKPPETLRAQNPEVPEDLERIILKLLEKDRTLRFQSGQQVMEALDTVPFAGSGSGRTSWGQPAAGIPSPSSRVLPPAREPSSRTMRTAAGESSGVLSSVRSQLGDRDRPMVHIPRAGSVRYSEASSTPPVAPAVVQEDVPPSRPGPSADEVLRPVHRVIPSDSSAILRAASAARESSAVQPVAPVQQPSAAAIPAAVPPLEEPPVAQEVPVVAAPEPLSSPPSNYDVLDPSSSAEPVARSRPIIPQSARSSLDVAIPKFSLPRMQSPRPTPRFTPADTMEPLPLPPFPLARTETAEEAKPASSLWLLLLVVLVLLGAGIAAWKLWPRSAANNVSRVIPLAVTPVNNTTGDSVLSGVVLAGFEMDLAQSPQFLVEEMPALFAGAHLAGIDPDPESLKQLSNARIAAQPIGATEILTAGIHSNGGSYTLDFSIHSVESGAEIAHAEATAQSRDQILDAIDRLVIDLRTASGEDNNIVTHTAVSLTKEASGNLEALNAYADGRDFEMRGQLVSAATAYEQAVTLDPHFSLAYLQLAGLYRVQRATTAAASSALSAQSNAQEASGHTQRLASAANEIDNTGNVAAIPALLKPLLDEYPNTVRGRLAAAQALRIEGKFPESLALAEAALHREPYNTTAVALSEIDLIAQSRIPAAQAVEADSVHAGNAHPELQLLMNFLNADEQGPIDTSADPAGHIALGEMQAGLRDAIGQMHDGLIAWRAVAVDASSNAQLYSAAADALSRAALNRAMLGDCADTSSLIDSAQNYPQGPDAQFRVGLSSALCGNIDTAQTILDTMKRTYPQSFAVTSLYVPDLNAAIQWKAGSAEAGLQTLQSATPYDRISMTPYLRAEMHLKTDPVAAIADFMFLLQQPGATVLLSPTLYAVAQLGLARAYAAHGDKVNSARNYSKFLTMWSDADPSIPLLIEARAGAAAH
jgi:serine/threonine protein kinase/tetratricopeptide (TPR) repeat protein